MLVRGPTGDGTGRVLLYAPDPACEPLAQHDPMHCAHPVRGPGTRTGAYRAESWPILPRIVRRWLSTLKFSTPRETAKMGETTRKQTEVGEWYLCGTCPSTQMAVPIIACVAPPHPAIQGDAANSVFTVGPVRCVF